MLELILPAGVKLHALRDPSSIDPQIVRKLFAIEESELGRTVDERLSEFQLGRFCARTALTQLGFDWLPIPIGPSREPVWPQCVTGSITHCNGYVAAAVAWSSAYCSLGIDAEHNLPLPGEVLSAVLTPEEVNAINALPNAGIHWDRLLFSAKECVFKAWFPRRRSWLEFHECSIRLNPKLQSFEAHLQLTSDPDAPTELRIMHGAYVADTRFLFTSIVVPNASQLLG